MRKITLPSAIVLATLMTSCSIVIDFGTQVSPSPILMTVTSTPVIPISQLNIDNLIVQDGDLPPAYSGAQIRNVPNDGMPGANKAIVQELGISGNVGGAVLIYLYDSVEKLPEDFDRLNIRAAMSDPQKQSVSIGEVSYTYTDLVEIAGKTRRNTDVLFRRCNVIVWIRFSRTDGGVQPYAVEAYAKRLDERLQPIVCR